MKRILCFILTAISVFALLGGCAKTEKTALLSNPNADETAQSVYEFLTQTYPDKTLSGQQESTWMDSPEYEMEYIYNASGKYPAIRGLDYMNDDFEGVNARALEWWNKGGLVSICWHCGADFSGAWEESQNTEISDWDAALKDGTPENKALLDGMDKGAKALAQLQEQGVTVLWRPFHEFDGGWFWWGKGTPRDFKKLWRLMYERYTEHWKLNNLIWVLGFSHNGEKINKWYPGNRYCDIVGADSYDGGAQPELYETVRKVHAKGKPLCFHECGANPTASELSETPWLWFLTWHTEYLTDNNDAQSLNELYNSDEVLTLDEIPRFSEGEKENMLIECSYSSGGGMDGGHCYITLKKENGKTILTVDSQEYYGAKEINKKYKNRDVLLSEINSLVSEEDVIRMTEAPESEYEVLDAPSSSLSFTFYDADNPYGRGYTVDLDKELDARDRETANKIINTLKNDK